MLRPGSRIDAYELVTLVGEGGMAQVWVARRRAAHGFEKLFAVKVVHTRLEDEARFRAMFLDEAKIAADVHHPNVAQVFDLGEQDGLLYLAMEYVDGESLASLAHGLEMAEGRDGIFPTDIALRIAREVCAGLEAAHTAVDAMGRPRGVVHRDVSPQNILLGVRGEVKLIDFGIAFAERREAGVTKDGTVRGKLHFMAPEQVRQKPLGPPADVFGIGATLYAMLVGVAPFAEENDLATLQRLASGPPARIPPQLPTPVRAVLARALARDPANRYPSAAALGEAVDEAADEIGASKVDLAGWVSRSLSPRARALREHIALAARSAPELADVTPPELGTKDIVVVSGNTKAWQTGAAQPAVPELGAAGASVLEPPPPPPPPPLPPRAAAPHLEIELDHGRSVGGTAALRAAPVPTVREPLFDATGSVPPAPPAPEVPAAGRSPAREPPPPQPTHQEPSREFFDVAALAERASRPDAAVDGEARPARAARAVSPPRAEPRRTAKPSLSPSARRALVAVALVGLLLAISVAAVPLWVKHRVTEAARAAGLTVGIERVSFSFGGVTLGGVTVRAAEVPGLSVRIEDASTRGLTTTELHLTDVTVELTGTAAEIAEGLARASARIADTNAVTDPREPPKPRHLVVSRARVAWSGPLGEGTRLVADGVALELEERVGSAAARARPTLGAPPGVVLRATSDRTTLATKDGTLGPWGLSAQLDGVSNRLRLLLDPALVDGPRALWTWGPSTPEQLLVEIPRVPLSTLGIPPGLVGLAEASAPEVEAHLESKLTPVGRVDARGKLEVWRVQLPGGLRPVDLRIEGSASGLPGKPLELDRTSVTVGPFVASASGTVEVGLAGARVEASWRLTPIPCERFVRSEAEGLGPLAVVLQDLGQVTGIARVTGSAQASGTFLLDTSAEPRAVFRAKTRETCGVSLFGR